MSAELQIRFIDGGAGGTPGSGGGGPARPDTSGRGAKPGPETPGRRPRDDDGGVVNAIREILGRQFTSILEKLRDAIVNLHRATGSKNPFDYFNRKKPTDTVGPSAPGGGGDDIIDAEFEIVGGGRPIANIAGPRALTTATAGAETAGAATAGAAAEGSMLASIGAIAGPIAAVVGASYALYKAFDYLGSKAVEMAESLAGYSPALSNASAMATMRQEQAEMRRAEAIGPQLASFYDAYSRFETFLYDVMTQILEILLAVWELLEPFVNAVITAFELGLDFLSLNWDALMLIFEAITFQWDAASERMDKIGKTTERMARRLERDNEQEEMKDMFFEELEKIRREMNNPKPPVQPA